MIRSMTGFATTTCSIAIGKEKIQLTMHLKTLNSRFFETSFKLPHALNHLETTLAKQLKKKFFRGRVYLTMHLSTPRLTGTITPAISTAQEYIKAILKIQNECNIEGSIKIQDILRLPDLFHSASTELNESVTKIISSTVDTLINDVIVLQEREGAVLFDDISERIASMQKEILTIEQLSLKLVEKHKQKVAKALQDLESDDSRFAELKKSALYSILDKIDTHEEIVRFKDHLIHISDQLKSNTLEKGKRLDFTLQELAREINTISAKCSDSAISKSAINTKVEVEKAREQVQNVL